MRTLGAPSGGRSGSMGWNLEHSGMTMLRGQFAIVLVLDAGPIMDGRVVEAALEDTAQELDLYFSVRPAMTTPFAFASDATVTGSTPRFAAPSDSSTIAAGA